jgi:hypothetical protein
MTRLRLGPAARGKCDRPCAAFQLQNRACAQRPTEYQVSPGLSAIAVTKSRAPEASP